MNLNSAYQTEFDFAYPFNNHNCNKLTIFQANFMNNSGYIYIMDISIIIPVFEESKKIGKDIYAASQFLETHSLTGEIIIVDDGSLDDTATAAKSVDMTPEIPIHVIRYPVNRGKGYAVRTGIKSSQGETVMFIDSGGCVPYENVLRGLYMLNNGVCDIAHGSRFLPESKILMPHARSRCLSSWIFRKFLTCLMNIPSELTDTQCGFKMYRGEVARALYGQCNTDGFMFDVEIILRARKQGFRIKEFPIEWTADHDSRLSQIRMPFYVLSELIRIKQILDRE